MSVFYRGSDLIYRIRALYYNNGEIIDLSSLTEITAIFCMSGREISYTLTASEITIDSNYVNIYIQRADFENQNEGSWNLKIETEEADAAFADSKRVRIGEVSNAFRLDEACR